MDHRLHAPRRLGIAALAVVVLLAAAALLALRARAGGQPQPPAYESAAVDRGPIAARVTASGNLSAVRTVAVSSQVSGRISELRADFNTRVARGQLLARIDPQPFRAAVKQAEANEVVARANVAKARAKSVDADAQAARAKALADRRFLSAQEWETKKADADSARAEIAAAEGSLAQARAALDQARFNLEMTEIRSPIDGIVLSRDLDVGQTVAASLQAPTLFTIAEDLRRMQIEAHVSESDVARLSEGMPASFTVDGLPGQRLSGTVRQVRNAATTVSNVVTYTVVVDVDNAGLTLRPGMTANVTFVVAERKDALRVPNAALRFQPPAGAVPAVPAVGRGGGSDARPEARPEARIVYVVEGAGLRAVPVRAGITDGSHTEVVEGALEPSVRVATQALAGSGEAKRSSGAGGGGGAAPPPPPGRMF
jgi:HlyD family secretion protein